jgi:predicted DNA-binding mobile mystery protein A
MKHYETDLRIRELDQLLSGVKESPAPISPPGGWIKAVREALGMSLQDFAERLKISKTAAFHIERAEAEDRITLARLRSAADALNCDLQVVIVPRSTIKATLANQAEAEARDIVSRANHSMALESQAAYLASQEDLVSETAQELLKKGRLKWK